MKSQLTSRAARLCLRRISGAVLALLAVSGSGCMYDAQNAATLNEKRNLVDTSVQNEVNRVKALFEKSAPRFEGSRVSRPVADAFNDDVQPGQQGTPAFGGQARIALNTEPKRLTSYLDSSASTSEINHYIYNGLIYQDPDTLEVFPDLATHWEAQDVVWLKGHIDKSVFEARSPAAKPDAENNYAIGHVLPESIVWADPEQTEVESLTVLVGGQPVTYTKDQLRVNVNDDGSYKRVFDRRVVFTFHLRQGVLFHDGKPFSADDVIFTLDTINNSKIPEMTRTRAAYSSVKHWEKLDDFTVKIYLNEQYFGALDLFGDGFQVLPKHVFLPAGQTFTEDEFAKHFRDHPAIDAPIGTGPYAFPSPGVLPELQNGTKEAWVRGNYVQLVRTGKFYDPYRSGYLDDISFYFYSGGGDVIMRAMNNNEVDFTRYFGSEELFKKSNSEQFRARFAKIFFFGPSYGYFQFNTRKPYFSDKRVRQAFNYIVDRDRFSNNVSYGIAVSVSGPQFNFGPFYNPSIKPYPYDRKKAEQLLNEAGWSDTDGDGVRDRDGVPFEVDILLNQGKGTIGEGLGFMMKEDLESMGVRVNFRRLEWASLLEHIDDRKFDLYSLSFSTDIESDPFASWHSSQWADRGQNTGGYNSPEADKLILRIRREVDEAKRRELHWQLHQVLHDDAAAIFLYNYPNRGAYDKRLRNVKLSGRRPGYFAWQWYIPTELQKPEEKTRAEARWKGVVPHPLSTAPAPLAAAHVVPQESVPSVQPTPPATPAESATTQGK